MAQSGVRYCSKLKVNFSHHLKHTASSERISHWEQSNESNWVCNVLDRSRVERREVIMSTSTPYMPTEVSVVCSCLKLSEFTVTCIINPITHIVLIVHICSLFFVYVFAFSQMATCDRYTQGKPTETRHLLLAMLPVCFFHYSSYPYKHIDFYWFLSFCSLLDVETEKYVMRQYG